MSAQKLSGLSSRAVTLPFVFDGFKDHRENEQTEQRGDDEGINHGASSKGCFWSSPASAQPVCQWSDRYMDSADQRGEQLAGAAAPSCQLAVTPASASSWRSASTSGLPVVSRTSP